MLSLPPTFDGNTAMDVTSCVFELNPCFRKQQQSQSVSTRCTYALIDSPVVTHLDHDVHFLEYGVISDAMELRTDHILRDILLHEVTTVGVNAAYESGRSMDSDSVPCLSTSA